MIKIGVGNIVVGTLCLLGGVALWRELHQSVGIVPIAIGLWILGQAISYTRD